MKAYDLVIEDAKVRTLDPGETVIENRDIGIKESAASNNTADWQRKKRHPCTHAGMSFFL